ncbi:lipid kinase, YegS/Rv2252/BmrU family [Pelagirhabdus alkalitolerans]|uniref:Lipid kinase, YegS/Rv2252/BmrU family n=1 Tax=Pelagirhabdus alkalitolerans TaxID=1612202 RepID=A0A1G6JXV5_9BACI|nr:diacylglycerol kinase family protein [Pelagirhabdus alkalitolerans]SDC22846.1 lipid kinase, YegS/Rv2252/BmrU family [Pelagirhabdus alkalitolerans]
MNLAFIVNPASGKGLTAFKRFKKKLTIPYRTYITHYPKHATKIIQHLLDEGLINVVIVVGGDGTIHEVINGMKQHQLVLGVIRNGSGNDFGRHFHTFKTARQLETFMKRKPKTVKADLGVYQSTKQQRLFINNSGIGFDAAVCQSINQSTHKTYLNRLKLGKLIYIYHVFKTLRTFEPFDLKLMTEDHEASFTNVWFLTASNQPFFGGGMKIAPQANGHDGTLTITIVQHLKRRSFLYLFWLVYKGAHTRNAAVSQMQVKQLTVQTGNNQVAHADGETYYITRHTPVHYQIQPKKIQLAKKT